MAVEGLLTDEDMGFDNLAFLLLLDESYLLNNCKPVYPKNKKNEANSLSAVIVKVMLDSGSRPHANGLDTFSIHPSI